MIEKINVNKDDIREFINKLIFFFDYTDNLDHIMITEKVRKKYKYLTKKINKNDSYILFWDHELNIINLKKEEIKDINKEMKYIIRRLIAGNPELKRFGRFNMKKLEMYKQKKLCYIDDYTIFYALFRSVNLRYLKMCYKKIFILFLQGEVTDELYKNVDKNQKIENIKINWEFVYEYYNNIINLPVEKVELKCCLNKSRSNWKKNKFPGLFVIEKKRGLEKITLDPLDELDIDRSDIKYREDFIINYADNLGNLTIYGLYYQFMAKYLYKFLKEKKSNKLSKDI